MSWISSAGSADSASASSEPGCAPLDSASSNRSAENGSDSSGPTSTCTTISKPSTADVGRMPISSAEDSPARTSAAPAPALDSTASGPACGSKCSESSVKLCRLGLLLRTSLLCELEALTGYSLDWKKAATAAGRSWWVLTTLERRTDGSACGSSPEEWPTPTASSYGTSNNGCPGDGRETFATKGKPSLETMAKWPTPTAGDAKSTGSRTTANSKAHPGISLTDSAVHGLTISDKAKRRADPTLSSGDLFDGLPDQAAISTSGKPPEASRLLNADWVFQLMGYPRTWARLSTKPGCRPPATPSCPPSPKQSGA